LVGDKSSELLHGRMKIKSLFWYPFGFKEHSYYALVLNQTGRRYDWSDEDISLIARVVTPVEIALQKIGFIKEKSKAEAEVKENLNRLKRTLEETVNALAVTAEKKDPYTAGHQRRVVKLAAAIAAEIGLGEEEAEGVRIAATVHDIGKIYIPVEILSKPGKLTDLEFGMVQAHSQLGFDILKTVDFPWPVAKIVLQHHERLNGSGYPLGLKGDEICQEARILAVADVVEAMVSDRPYRDGLDRAKVLAELDKGAGVFYDKDVVAACAKIISAKGFSLD
jgi:putative nucleotidyltransferase with HDIG domain